MQLQVGAPCSASAVHLIQPSGAHPASHLPPREGQTDGIWGHEESWPRVTSALALQTLLPAKEVPQPLTCLPPCFSGPVRRGGWFLSLPHLPLLSMAGSFLNKWQRRARQEQREGRGSLEPPLSPSLCPPGWGKRGSFTPPCFCLPAGGLSFTLSALENIHWA